MIDGAQFSVASRTMRRRPLATRVLYALVKLEIRGMRADDRVLDALAEDHALIVADKGDDAGDLVIWRRVSVLHADELLRLVETAEAELMRRGMQPFAAPEGA